MRKYELLNERGEHIRCGNPFVEVNDDGTETLFSYLTPICERDKNGNIRKIWGGWSQTTGKHIKAFCGLNKAQFMKLPQK